MKTSILLATLIFACNAQATQSNSDTGQILNVFENKNTSLQNSLVNTANGRNRQSISHNPAILMHTVKKEHSGSAVKLIYKSSKVNNTHNYITTPSSFDFIENIKGRNLDSKADSQALTLKQSSKAYNVQFTAKKVARGRN